MSNKSFSIYGSEEFAVEDNDQLVIEIAKSHMACIVTKENRKAIAAYELFSFNEDEGKNLNQLFANLAQHSKILSKPTPSVSIYINNELCIPVPIFKFNKEIAAEYLNVVFGEDGFSKNQFEHLPVEPGIMNVYRVNEDYFNFLHQHFTKVNFHHVYSSIIRRLANITSALPAQLIIIQFYNTFMIVVVMKDDNLHLIQTFVYQTPEDVLYYLFNITNQFELYSKSLTIQISGMIDLDFKLYRELITYFKQVIVENVDQSNLALNIGEHPLHYFTPFFNLAL